MIQEALPADAPALVHLFALLGHDVNEGDLTARVEGSSTLAVEAKARARAEGCELLELTSNDRLTHAQAFYAAQGFEPTSKRFVIRL